jgi:hypothetical protein
LQHSESSSSLSKPKPAVTHWPSMNPFTTYYTPSHLQSAQPLSPADVNSGNSDLGSIASPDRGYESRGPSVSLDDPEVRLAAEALGDLKAGMSRLGTVPAPAVWNLALTVEQILATRPPTEAPQVQPAPLLAPSQTHRHRNRSRSSPCSPHHTPDSRLQSRMRPRPTTRPRTFPRASSPASNTSRATCSLSQTLWARSAASQASRVA